MMEGMQNGLAVFRREWKSYFESPVAYVFLVGFLLLTGFLTFAVTRFFERQAADLQPFFFWHPWVYLLLVPAATMGLWAEERRAGTIELLLTLPVTLRQTIVGKFMAAWLFISLALALTFPIVLTTLYLGQPDMGVIWGGYVGSFLMAGAYVSVGMLTSALTRSQVIAFVLSLMLCLLLLLAGWPPVTHLFVQWAPVWLVEAVAAFSFSPHYDALQRGVLDLRDVGYYLSVIVFMLAATHVVLESRKTA